MTQHHSRKWFLGDVGITALVLGLAACGRLTATDAFTALEIQQVQILGGDCTVPGEPTAAHRTAGRLDLDLPDRSSPPYYLPVSVINNFSNSSAGSAAEEMNNITLTHFTVELSAPNVDWSDSCPAVFDSTEFSFLLGPGDSTGAGLYALTPAHSRCLLPYVPEEGIVVTARVRAKGRHGGTTIESAPLVFPITLCKGCLQQGYNEPSLAPYSYPSDFPLCSAFSGVNPYVGDLCLPPGQDSKILCCGLTMTIDGVPRDVAVCPAVFTGDTSTTTSTSTGL